MLFVVEEMSVITPFDPWRGRFCTCPPKYSLSPYVGCAHQCLYCYITAYNPDACRLRPKKDFLKKLRRDLRKVAPRLHISISNSSDPYPPQEAEKQLTRRALQEILSRGLRVQIITKSDIVCRDVDIVSRGNCSVSITITTLDESLAKKLEPNAPSPKKRLSALEKLVEEGVPCSARVDPLIPGLNDEEAVELVGELASIGVLHICSSTYKAKPDNFQRLVSAFPEFEQKLRKLYWVEGQKVGRARYLPSSMRKEMLLKVRKEVDRYGLTFGVCREGFPSLNSGATCDGSHLIPKRFGPTSL